ncbi:hypothetical protein EJD97_014750 [Solanum chilense]|uniref:Uncharacterized protein n=2 Tax=Solanum subgen. Lycopersicon TaxID=49274 RepID=K4CPA9_SOLLC|nr:hypothetical protein EJD97_014750 [Solanum chilense]
MAHENFFAPMQISHPQEQIMICLYVVLLVNDPLWLQSDLLFHCQPNLPNVGSLVEYHLFPSLYRARER